MSENTKEALDAVNIGNIKTVAEAGAHSMGSLFQGNSQMQLLAQQNAVAHQNRMNILAESVMANATKALLTPPGLAAASGERLVTAGDIPSQGADLGAVIAMLQQIMKGAQTTPPVTAPE